MAEELLVTYGPWRKGCRFSSGLKLLKGYPCSSRYFDIRVQVDSSKGTQCVLRERERSHEVERENWLGQERGMGKLERKERR